MARKQAIQISDHFTLGRLLRFTVPSIVMMIFTSTYSIVDGLFVSNCAGKTPFAALNLVYPLIAILGTFGFMMGTGGSALVAKTLGEGDAPRANRIFSMIVRTTVEMGVVLVVAGAFLVEPVCRMLGAEGELLYYAKLYGWICLIGLIPFMLQNVFQSFFVTAGKPKLGLAVVVGAGLTNIVLDALFIVGFGWGLAGAAAATVAGQFVGGLLPVVYFVRKNPTDLHLFWTGHDVRAIAKVCVNGSSELMTNLAASLVSMLYNWQLMRMIGEDGVAAYGVIMYVAFIFAAVFIGYSIGMAPLVSYNYGARNHDELRGLLRKSLAFIAVLGVVLIVAAQAFAGFWSHLFVGYNADLLELTVYGMRLYALSFLLCGFNIFGSAFFTALNNGVVSAVIAFMRTLVFECGGVILMPILLGVNGIWLSIVVAEFAALLVTTGFLVGLRREYHY